MQRLTISSSRWAKGDGLHHRVRKDVQRRVSAKSSFGLSIFRSQVSRFSRCSLILCDERWRFQVNLTRIVDSVSRDLQYALRTMRKRPGFAVTTVLTLALVIGANTAIFTVVRAVLLRPLRYSDPERLVEITGGA